MYLWRNSRISQMGFKNARAIGRANVNTEEAIVNSEDKARVSLARVSSGWYGEELYKDMREEAPMHGWSGNGGKPRSRLIGIPNRGIGITMCDLGALEDVGGDTDSWVDIPMPGEIAHPTERQAMRPRRGNKWDTGRAM